MKRRARNLRRQASQSRCLKEWITKENKKMIKHLRRTWKNKVAALVIAFAGYLTTFIDGDATAFVFLLLIAVLLFFARRNLID
jgi:hypothetical protein